MKAGRPGSKSAKYACRQPLNALLIRYPHEKTRHDATLEY